jgi:hypothetical protein
MVLYVLFMMAFLNAAFDVHFAVVAVDLQSEYSGGTKGEAPWGGM